MSDDPKITEMKDKMIDSVCDSTFSCPREWLTASISTAPKPLQVGKVEVAHTGIAISINDPKTGDLDEKLGEHGWEAGTIRLTHEGKLVISVWETGR